jgi:hypothetical protein
MGTGAEFKWRGVSGAVGDHLDRGLPGDVTPAEMTLLTAAAPNDMWRRDSSRVFGLRGDESRVVGDV